MGMFERDVMCRLTRLESKLVRGFEEMGVNISNDENWLVVDDDDRTVHLTTLGRSMMVMLVEMERRGATRVGKEYDIFYQGESVGSLVYRPVFPCNRELSSKNKGTKDQFAPPLN